MSISIMFVLKGNGTNVTTIQSTPAVLAILMRKLILWAVLFTGSQEKQDLKEKIFTFHKTKSFKRCFYHQWRWRESRKPKARHLKGFRDRSWNSLLLYHVSLIRYATFQTPAVSYSFSFVTKWYKQAIRKPTVQSTEILTDDG